jgi:hypothetical protein
MAPRSPEEQKVIGSIPVRVLGFYVPCDRIAVICNFICIISMYVYLNEVGKCQKSSFLPTICLYLPTMHCNR